MLIHIIILLWATMDRLCMAQKYRCDREEVNADLRIKEMFLFAADQQDFPTNEVQMKAFCKDSKRRESEMKTYVEKCLNSNTKSVTNLLTYSVSKNTANTCKSRRRTQDFQRVGACGNAARKGARKCWNNWIDTTYSITRISDHKLKIPMACCYVSQMGLCLTKAYEKQPKLCKQKSIEYLDNMFDTYLSDSMALMCGDYGKDNDMCDKLINKMPKTTAKASGENKSPIRLMVGILDSLPS